MEKNIETYYRTYQKKSDPLVLKSYYDLEKKAQDKTIMEAQLLENNNRLTAVKKVIEERNLFIKKHTPKSNQKNNSNNAYKDAGKSLLIGILFIAISLGLMEMFDGNKIFLIGVIIGAFKILEGIITGAVGFFFNITQNK